MWGRDSAVIELPQGAVVLIDGGRPMSGLIWAEVSWRRFLWNRGIRDTSITSSGRTSWIMRRRVGLDFGPFAGRALLDQRSHTTRGVLAKIGRALLQRHVSATVAQEGDSWRRRAVVAWWR